MPGTNNANSAFVLIPGGGLGSWSWQRVIPLLQLPALAVDLPALHRTVRKLRTLTIEGYADALAETIRAADVRECIVVAHSMAGVIAPAVAARLPDSVRHLMFVAAHIPAPGTSVLDTLSPQEARLIRLALQLVWIGVTPPRWAARQAVRQQLCTDMDEATARFVLDRYDPTTPGFVADRVQYYAASLAVPRTSVRPLRDQESLSPVKQDQMIANLGGADVAAIDTGHTAMIRRPEALARILNRVAEHRGHTKQTYAATTAAYLAEGLANATA